MKISFTGAGCSGKSTLLKRCRDHYRDRFAYITEVTRPIARKGLPINESGGDQTQRAIIEAHIENNKLNDVVMDRCIVDGAVYTTWLAMNGDSSISDTVLQYAWNTFDQIVNDIDIIFYTEPLRLESDGQRSTNRDFQRGIDSLITSTLFYSRTFKSQYQGKVIILKGDVETRFNDIKIAIEQHEHCTTR